MTALAWRSVRARRTAFLATAVSILLGTAVILAFASLIETARGDGVSSTDRETLVVVGAVVGNWGLVIVVFSVASMLALTVRRRAEEFALLRTVGSTRGQVRRMVVGEAIAVAALAGVLGLLPGRLLGRGVLALLRDADMVSAGVAYEAGWVSVGAVLATMLVAAALAGLLAARTATRGSAQGGLTASRTPRVRLSRAQIALGLLLVAVGATYSVLTVTVMADSDDPYAAMSTAGPASVFWSIGLAVLSPLLLRATSGAVAPLVRGLAHGLPAHLALASTQRRAHDLGGVLMPVLIFVGISTGTLYLMQIENRTVAVHDAVGASLELVNYLVVGMIATFAAIMVVNGTVAAVTDRRREFAQQRLAGITRRELTATVAAETLVLVVAATLFGGLASLGTVIPYSVVKTDGWLSVSGPGFFLGVVAVALVVSLGTAVVATRRATAGPAVRPSLG